MNDGTRMTDDDLRRSLFDADAASFRGLPPISADRLLTAARQRRSRTLRARAVFAAASACALALVIVTPWSKPPSGASASLPTVEDLCTELACLEREAAIHQQVVRGLRQAERMAVHKAEFNQAAQTVEPALAAQEAARSAAISLQYAAIVEQESADLERAKREYRRVSERFPGTDWAAVATASLARLSSPGQERPSL